MTMASALFAALTEKLNLDGTDIDTWPFKLYSRITPGLFMVAGAASMFSEVVGKAAITCDDANDYETNYCWFHGVEHLKPGGISKDIHGSYCFSTASDGGEKIWNYYIWISLVMFLCGAAFLVPNEIWKRIEGGMLSQFEGMKKMTMDKETREKIAKQFLDLTNNFTRTYFITFVLFEVMYLFLGIAVFLLLDSFLDGKFMTYGLDAFEHFKGKTEITSITDRVTKATIDVPLDPMCSVFPTVVSCTIKTFAVVEGAKDTKNTICMLGQNIMNQKIFLVLWLWFTILWCVSLCQIIYRVTTILVPSTQEWTIQFLLKSTDKDLLTAIRKLKLRNGNVGNWFLLTQIGSNSDPYAFRQFLEDVSGVKRTDEEKQRQKRQKTNRETIDQDGQPGIPCPEGGVNSIPMVSIVTPNGTQSNVV